MKFVDPLSPNVKAILTDLFRSSPSHKVRRRAHCVLLSDKGYPIEKLSEIFDVDRDTIGVWLAKWNELGVEGLQDAPRSGRPRKDQAPSPSDLAG